MSSFTKKRKDGFTIIEVMIVLAIAGLIMLIVFLAVPALQRTARNTTRKADASAIAAAVASYIDNNGGTLPTGIGNDATDTTTLVIGTTTPSCALVAHVWGCNTETAKLGYYTANTTAASITPLQLNSGNVWLSVTPAAPAPVIIAASGGGTPSATNISTNTISIITGWSCNGTNTGISTTSNSRTAAILYVTETGSGNGSLQCVEQ